MKNNLKIGLVASLALVIVLTAGVLVVKGNTDGLDINEVLEGEDYIGLNDQAKAYIKAAYEATGNVVLTEQNKQENIPYLNPDYEDYLALSDEERAEVAVVPSVYKVDYVPSMGWPMRSSLVTSGEGVDTGQDADKDKDSGAERVIANLVGNDGDGAYENGSETLPAKFDLRDIDGGRYITELKNQGGLGICWTFATVEQAESMVMLKSEEPLNSDTLRLSPRQFDYASSIDGIKNYENAEGMRALTSGGNFLMASLVAMDGVAYSADSGYNESQASKELAEVLNYDNTIFETTSTLKMPTLADGEGDEEYYNGYVEMVKNGVADVGGAYVQTGSPAGACGAKNIDGKYVVSDDAACHSTSGYDGHAMQIIGWDDDYEYEFCATSGGHIATSQGGCANGKYVKGKGAWILRNSWGEGMAASYAYLAYDSPMAEVAFTTGLSGMGARAWDNNYHHHNQVFGDSMYYINTDVAEQFVKKVPGAEKVELVKFITENYGGKYMISVKSKSKEYKNIMSVETDFPGVYTVDLSGLDIVIDDDEFSVEISSTDTEVYRFIVVGSMSVFTSNVDKTPLIAMQDVTADEDALEGGDFETLYYVETKNVPSNGELEFSLMLGDTDKTEMLTVANNAVAINNSNPTLKISKDAGYGEYTLVAKYGEAEFSAKVVLPSSAVEPSEPSEPSEPENPDNPDGPGGNTDPDNPDNPDSPDNPSEPDEPSDPDGPDNPDGPTDLDQPAEPDKPEVTEDETMTVKDESILLTDGNDFAGLKSKFGNQNAEFKHLDKSGVEVVREGLATGDKIKITLSNGESYEYGVSVLGDIDGDGKTTAMEYIKIRKHIMRTNIIPGGVYLYAADINHDGAITAMDYVKVRNYIMNGGSL